MRNLFDPDRFREIPPQRIRIEIESEVDRLIDYLDSLEPDCDLEPDNAGTLGWLEDAEGDDCDLEADDCDHEGDDREDLEPSLGWTVVICQDGPIWLGDSYGDDREFESIDVAEWDEAERGIADLDGLAEQYGALGQITGVL